MKYFVNVLVDVLGAVYQAAGASLLIAVLIMCVYMLGRKQGVGPVARAWIWQFKESSWFRRHFFLVFYTCMAFPYVILSERLGKSVGKRDRNLGTAL
ncbi:MAG: hypothetical protein ACLVB1_09880 [Blautia obeum]